MGRQRRAAAGGGAGAGNAAEQWQRAAAEGIRTGEEEEGVLPASLLPTPPRLPSGFPLPQERLTHQQPAPPAAEHARALPTHPFLALFRSLRFFDELLLLLLDELLLLQEEDGREGG